MLLGVGGYYHSTFSGRELPPCGPAPLVRLKGKNPSCCIPKDKAFKGVQLCCGPQKIAKAIRQAGGKFSMVCKPWNKSDPGGPGDVSEDPRDTSDGGGGGSIFDESGDIAGSVPTWAWIAGAGIIAFTLLKKKKGGSDAKA